MGKKNVSKNSKTIKEQDENASKKKVQIDEEKQEEKREALCLRVSVSDSNGELPGSILRAKPKHHKRWNRRFKLLLCCAGYKRNKDSIADVASIFADFFVDLKLSSSDIVAAMVLVSKFQAAQRDWVVRNRHDGIEQILSNVPIRADTKFLDLSNPEVSHLVNDLIYYMNYSLAVFGWPLQMLEDPCKVCCIYPHLRWPSCNACRKRPKQKHVQPAPEAGDKNKNNTTTTNVDNNTQQSPEKTKTHDDRLQEQQLADKEKISIILEDEFNPIVIEDNCCGCNWASAESRLVEHNFEIIYITYHSDVSVVPFLVAADHAKQTIVVSIRGSMNLSDAVTDMNGQVDSVPIDNCPDGWISHRGMTRAALHIKNKIINERILTMAFNCRPDLDSQNYNLLLCGHSLGAGVASLLGIIMRPLYPNLKAYLYSPPGGIMSLPVAEYTKEFAIGIILGNDAVARLGMAQVERARYQMLLALKNSERSTCKILFKAFCPSSCCHDDDVEFDPEQSLDLLYGQSAKSFEFQGNEVPFQSAPEVMYVPGRLIHVVRNHGFQIRRRSSFGLKKVPKKPIYQAIWSTDNHIYDRMIFCENMLLDHMPNRLMAAMKMLFKRTLPDRRDSTKPVQITISQDDSDHSSTSDGDERIIPATKCDRSENIVVHNLGTSGADKSSNDIVIAVANHQTIEGNIYPILKQGSEKTSHDDQDIQASSLVIAKEKLQEPEKSSAKL